MEHDVIAARIKELKDNYQAGQEQLHHLETRQRELQNILLRISGAIQVLEELQQDGHNVPAMEPASPAPSMHIAK